MNHSLVVQHNVALCFLNLVSLGSSIGVIPGVELGDINNNINVVGTHFVASHVNGAGIRSDVDLAQNVKEVGLLKATVVGQGVDQVFEGRQVWDKLLNDLAERLKDRVIVDGGKVVVDRSVLVTSIAELIRDTLHDILEGIGAVLIGQTVNFVDEDFDVNARVVLLNSQDSAVETRDRVEVVILGINDPNKGAKATEDVFKIERGLEVFKLTGEVPDLEVHERAVGKVSDRFSISRLEQHVKLTGWSPFEFG